MDREIDLAYLEMWGITPSLGICPDESLARSRLFDNSELDSCLLGTALNESGRTVLVYDEAQLLAHFRLQGAEPNGENSLFDQIGAPYLYHRIEGFLEERGEWAPLVFRVGNNALP